MSWVLRGGCGGGCGRPARARPMESDDILFCPFCRECFEGEEVCPVHELRLVRFEKLPQGPRAVPREDERVAAHELRFGRGFVWLGAVLSLIGFVLPWLTVHRGAVVVASGLDIAAQRAISLYVVPATAIASIATVLRRRTPRQMR